jgi:methylamine methyltransferase corrinoid activation protein
LNIKKKVRKDIEHVGAGGLSILKEIGIFLEVPVDKCIFCQKCVKECPEDALEIVEIDSQRIAKYDSQKCLGTSCRRCVSICPESAIDITKLKITAK